MEKEKKLEQMLRTELMAESKRILEEVASDDSLRDVSIPEEMEDALEKGIREFEEARASYERLSEEDKEALRLGRELLAQERDTADTDVPEEHAGNVFGRKITGFRKRSRKACALVVIAATLVLAMGMTSIGGAPFLIEIGQQLIGNKEEVRVDSKREGDDNERKADIDQQDKFYQEMKEEFNFEPVSLEYLPTGAKFINYEIDKDLLKGCLFYQCGKDIIEYRIILNYQDGTHSLGLEDQVVDNYEIRVDNQVINVKQRLIEGEGYCYTAEFEYKNAFYTINAMLKKSEFEKILKNLYFF